MQPEQTIPAERASRVTLRSVLIGLLLVPMNAYWVVASELYWYLILTLNPLFVTPIFYLFLLVGANAVLRRVAPRHAFTPAELVVIYVMLVMSCTIATHDFIINLMTLMPWARWFATPENRWEASLFPHLPHHLLVWDKELLEGYFQGHSSLFRPEVLRLWLAPLARWSVFILSIGWIMLCLASLLRRAWTDHARLSFPIVRLPLVLTEGHTRGTMLRSQVLWGGFALAFLLDLVNGLHEWYPFIPHFQVRARWIPISIPSWNASTTIPLTCYPFAIGLAYLVPLDVAFSCGFFFLFFRAQTLVGQRLGYGNTPGFPFESEQAMGAWVAFALVLLYSSRRHLREVWHAVLHAWEADDRGEPLRYRIAFVGLLFGLAVFFVFWRQAGMSALWVTVTLGLYILLSISITRVRAEAGGQHTAWDLEPMRVMRLFDSSALGPANIGAAAISHWYWRLNRSHPMPSQLEAFRLAQERGMNLRALVAPLMLAFAVAIPASMGAFLDVVYRQGALAKCVGFANWTGYESFNFLETGLKIGFEPQPERWIAAVGAAVLTLALFLARVRFVGFPLHPLGYCIAPNLLWHWFPFLIAWLIKWLILRYGGLKLYRRALPFFLGLVLGDYVAGSIWALIGVMWDVPVYLIFH